MNFFHRKFATSPLRSKDNGVEDMLVVLRKGANANPFV